jgi:glycerophosphoryl diester phosphodiesterase
MKIKGLFTLHRNNSKQPVEIRSVRCRGISVLCALSLAAAVAPSSSLAEAAPARSEAGRDASSANRSTVQLGPRPFFLVDDMPDGPLKSQLRGCAEGPFRRTRFSIGHRGAPLQFPEHTRESYIAAARMGAGIIECDVTFTRDKELVCRHAQDDLATTTNILATPLAAKCSQPFRPAAFDADGNLATPATAVCRTSDVTLAEFKTLRGKMDASNPRARTPQEFMQGTPGWRTDLYAGPTTGTLMTHRESIELFKALGVQMTPELKSPVVTMPFDGFSQQDYARKMIDEYVQAGVSPRDVWPQSFNREDVLFWVRHKPDFGKQAVYLEDAETVAALPTAAELAEFKRQGINVWAPPIFALLRVGERNEIRPSEAALDARAAGLDIIAWSLERSGILGSGPVDFYYQTVAPAVTRQGDVMTVLDVLARQVGVRGVFSDWPATTTYYANCAGLD